MKIELEYIEKIAKIIAENSLSEVTVGQGDDIITIRRDSVVAVPAAVTAPVQAAVQQPAKERVEVKSDVQESQAQESKAITSPMVGAFYASPAPGAKPFVKVGDTVSVGQVVCIVEAMKLMNEIESEVSGRVTQICVEDGQSVEYGQVLMYIE